MILNDVKFSRSEAAPSRTAVFATSALCFFSLEVALYVAGVFVTSFPFQLDTEYTECKLLVSYLLCIQRMELNECIVQINWQLVARFAVQLNA